MNLATRSAPPLRLVLVILALVAIFQLPTTFLTLNFSPILGIILNEVVVILIIPIAVILVAGYSPVPLVMMKRPSNKVMLVAVCTTLGLAILLSYMKFVSGSFVHVPRILIDRHTQIVLVHSWHDFFLKLALLGIVAPICEEIFFRGILQSSLERRIGAWPAIIITAVLFALLHSTSFYPHLLLVLGLSLSWLYHITGTIRVPIVCHAISNCWALVNQIRGVKIPVFIPPGTEDIAFAGSAAVIVIAGVAWLYYESIARNS